MGEVYRARDTKLEPGRRREGPARIVRERPRGARPVRTRSARRRGAEPPEHPFDLRLRYARRHGLRRHGAARRGNSPRKARRGRAPAAPGRRGRSPDREGARRRARKGRRPSGPQARERLSDGGRPRQDPRLRSREEGRPLVRRDERSDDARRHRARHRHGDRRLHVARAGSRARRRRAERHLLFGAVLYEMLSGKRAFKRTRSSRR